MPWKPGQSGNPAGKMPGNLKDLAKARFTKAWDRLDELLLSSDERIVIDAIKIVFDRGEGRAPQAVEIADNGQLGTLTLEQLTTLKAKLARHIETVKANGNKPAEPAADSSH